jgi:hypothetical protein
MLVSHSSKEHILNAENKKSKVYVISFSQHREESMNPEPAERKEKTKSLN